jgi:WbqC-like protein family
MTRVVISQPMYFPWAGFMAQMALADVYIWLDDVQFSRGFTNRVQVKSQAGTKWLSIPLTGGGGRQIINQLAPAELNWPLTQRHLLRQAYINQPYFNELLELLDLATSRTPLIECIIASAELTAQSIGILPSNFLRSSQLSVRTSSSERILQLVKAVGGTEYITGHGALGYLNHESFEDAGIDVSYMDYSPLPWPQSHGEFTPYVTILDLISAVSASQAKAYLNPKTMEWRHFKSLKEENR